MSAEDWSPFAYLGPARPDRREDDSRAELAMHIAALLIRAAHLLKETPASKNQVNTASFQPYELPERPQLPDQPRRRGGFLTDLVRVRGWTDAIIEAHGEGSASRKWRIIHLVETCANTDAFRGTVGAYNAASLLSDICPDLPQPGEDGFDPIAEAMERAIARWSTSKATPDTASEKGGKWKVEIPALLLATRAINDEQSKSYAEETAEPTKGSLASGYRNWRGRRLKTPAF